MQILLRILKLKSKINYSIKDNILKVEKRMNHYEVTDKEH